MMNITTTGTFMLHDPDGDTYRKHIMVKYPTKKDPTVRELVWVNPEKIDPIWKRTDPHYLGNTVRDKKYIDLETSLGKRSERMWPLEVSSVGVNKNGYIGFTDGRHRFAYLRNNGYNPIPVGMDAESIQYAKQYGYLVQPPSLAESLIQEIL
jgi:hypothetical protein